MGASIYIDVDNKKRLTQYNLATNKTKDFVYNKSGGIA